MTWLYLCFKKILLVAEEAGLPKLGVSMKSRNLVLVSGQEMVVAWPGWLPWGWSSKDSQEVSQQ